MRRLCVVHLEASGQCALRELVWVVTEEGIVIAQQSVVYGIVRQQQILVLFYDLRQKKKSVKYFMKSIIYILKLVTLHFTLTTMAA